MAEDGSSCIDRKQLLRSESLDHSGFKQADYYVWGSSVVRAEDGRYHMFASRWPRATGPNGWVVASEVVHATSTAAEGPFRFKKRLFGRSTGALRHRWDALSLHNPTVHYDARSRRYALFYIGTSAGDGGAGSVREPPARSEYERAWNTKRIGVATAASVLGPWERREAPILQPRSGSWDGAITSNPAAWIHRNGSVVLLYKSILLTYPQRSHASPKPAFHIGAATAPSLAGPYVRISDEPVLQWGGKPFAAEDPYLWWCGGKYHLLFKCMQFAKAYGLRMGELAYTSSPDLRMWEEPAPALNKTLTRISSSSGARRAQTVARLERPQALLSDAGQLTHVFCAVATASGRAKSIALRAVVGKG